jgi:hypothetical protein
MRLADSITLRRKPPQKAWQGANPFTQRPSNSINSNGVVNTLKANLNSTPLPSESASPMKHLDDRMIYLLANLTVSLISTDFPLEHGF